MRNGYKVTLSILTIMILMTLTIGTSYSYYSISAEQEEPNVLSTTCFKINFTETTGSTISLNTDGKYAYPMSESTATSKLTPYNFTITNTCTSASSAGDTNYVILLSTLTTTTSDLTSYLNFKLNQTSPSIVAGTTTALTANTYTELPADIISEYNLDTNYVLETGTLEPGTNKTFNLYLWIKEDACSGGIYGSNDCETNVMGKSFTGKILVYTYM